MSQRRVLFIGAVLVAAGIGAPTTAIMAPRWSAELPPAAPAPPAPPAPVFSEGGPAPSVPVDATVLTSPPPDVAYVPPGTVQNIPAPPPHGGGPRDTRSHHPNPGTAPTTWQPPPQSIDNPSPDVRSFAPPPTSDQEHWPPLPPPDEEPEPEDR